MQNFQRFDRQKKTQKMDFLKIAHKMAADCQEVLLQKQQDMLY